MYVRRLMNADGDNNDIYEAANLGPRPLVLMVPANEMCTNPLKSKVLSWDIKETVAQGGASTHVCVRVCEPISEHDHGRA